VLLHPTSLPGGRLGPEAYRFVDWLAAAGQSWWQVLPLNPPDEHGSPYNSISAFATSAALLAEPRARVARDEAASFRARNAFWIEDYAEVAGGAVVEDGVRFEREWGALRAYGTSRGVRLVGDVPMFVSRESVDVHAHPELFRLDAVAGAPPDSFNRHGQLWGSALYDWPALRRTGYRWWVERLRRTFAFVDVARLDHFRGFIASWAVPLGNRTARRGRWQPGPGAALFHAAEAELGPLALVAEDLGRITEPVERLRVQLGLPGIRVLQFAFGGSARNPHRLGNLGEWCVVFTGTHDNDTTVGWFASLGPALALRTGLDPREPHWALTRLAFASAARVAIVPAQDLLGLGSEARMNTPGRMEGNWSWRLRRGQLSAALAERLRAETAAARRLRRVRRSRGASS
jgi:4-alpha-glucanotransferase